MNSTGTQPLRTFSWLGVGKNNYGTNDISLKKTVIHGRNDTVRTDIRENAEQVITAENGVSFTVIQFADAENDVFFRTEIDIGDNSDVRLVQIFAGKQKTVSELNVKIAENAGFHLIQLYISGNDNISSAYAELRGRCSHFSADIGYSADNSESIDIDLRAVHYGRKSESRISADGSLNGSSRKIFRGTIDFRNGSSGAKGSEQENVLLLNENAVNKTLPVILCSEENVEGNHGATIGRIDERHIFYMRSRGIPDEKIYKILSQARLIRLIKMIGDKQTEQRIKNITEWCGYDE